jgi:hypothetical protein
MTDLEKEHRLQLIMSWKQAMNMNVRELETTRLESEACAARALVLQSKAALIVARMELIAVALDQLGVKAL